MALAEPAKGLGGFSPPPPRSTGTAPYTKEQVAEGSEIYSKDCAVCHGESLQGVSAPALTGTGFARSHLSGSQLRDIVTQTMPLTAPGSLKPDEYMAFMAFLLSYDCIQPAGNGLQAFPTADLPALKEVELGAGTCPTKK